MPNRRARSRRVKPVTRDKLLESSAAQEALAKLRRYGVDEQKLFRLLKSIPGAPDEKLPLVNGMSDRQVTRLPEKIWHWANEIDKVNSSPWLQPSVLPRLAGNTGNINLPKPLDFLCSTRESATNNAETFRRLPETIRLYADYLKTWIKFMNRPHNFSPVFRFPWSLRGFRSRNILVLQLIKLVSDSAGRPCYAEMVTLLGAAFTAAGIPIPKMVTEDGVRKLVANNPVVYWALYTEVWS